MLITHKMFKDCKSKLDKMKDKPQSGYVTGAKMEKLLEFLKIGCATVDCLARKLGINPIIVRRVRDGLK